MVRVGTCNSCLIRRSLGIGLPCPCVHTQLSWRWKLWASSSRSLCMMLLRPTPQPVQGLSKALECGMHHCAITEFTQIVADVRRLCAQAAHAMCKRSYDASDPLAQRLEGQAPQWPSCHGTSACRRTRLRHFLVPMSAAGSENLCDSITCMTHRSGGHDVPSRDIVRTRRSAAKHHCCSHEVSGPKCCNL